MFDRTAELYDLFYEWKDYRAEAQRIRALVFERQRGASSLLDVACGTGSHLVHLREWFAAEGLDVDEGLLAVARAKLPETALHHADMRDFDLGRTFDVVTCLFSSIGYVESIARLERAIVTMARHVTPGGLLFVEPWLTREAFDPTHLGRLVPVERPGLQAVRMNGSRVEGSTSVLDFHYLVARPGSVEHLTETHVLGLFTDEEMRATFERAGLEVEHDREGLMGRGLWIGLRR